jgi:hypothetical protein
MKIRNVVFAAMVVTVFAGCNQVTKDIKSKNNSIPENPMIYADPGNDSTSHIKPDIQMLKGNWIRSDAEYRIEIYSASPEGKLDARYFNPKRINVDSAEWITKDNKIFIRVILRDVNYPGSTYTLEYLPENDALSGNYFQAMEAQNFDVQFYRKN